MQLATELDDMQTELEHAKNKVIIENFKLSPLTLVS